MRQRLCCQTTTITTITTTCFAIYTHENKPQWFNNNHRIRHNHRCRKSRSHPVHQSECWIQPQIVPIVMIVRFVLKLPIMGMFSLSAFNFHNLYHNLNLMLFDSEIMIIYIEPIISLEALCQEMRDICKFNSDQLFTMKFIDDDGKICFLNIL